MGEPDVDDQLRLHHIGNFAAAGEATARALLFGGVPLRHPRLRFAFQEGGVAWASALLAGLVGHYEKRNRQAIEHYRRGLEANPDTAAACNDLAWAYLTAPEALRDVEAALPLAEKAVRLASRTAIYRNTLGVAYYRAGRYREAVEILRSNVEKQEDWALAYDLYFLAMSHHRLGETERARHYYDWAVRWVSAQPDLRPECREELVAFRAEAEELFGSQNP